MDIGALLKQQSLAVLMDVLGKPAAGAGGIASAAQSTGTATNPVLNLTAGETIAARVTAVKPDGTLVLALKGQPVQAEVKGTALPEAVRQAGASISLRVETTGHVPKLAFVGVETVPPAQGKTASVTTLPSPQRTSAIFQNTQQVSTATSITTVRIVEDKAPRSQPSPAPTADPQTAAVSRAATEAATKQGSATHLYADLAALTSRGYAALPKPIVAIAQALLATRLDGERPVTVETLKQAIAQSGVLQEAHLARGEASPLDAKALLTTLRDALRSGADRFIPPDAEPPRRDGSVSAQKASTPLLAEVSDPKTIAATLGKEAEQAVERVKLHQIASLPDHRPGATDQQRPQQLSFEIPIAFGQQTAMAGFRIEREKRQSRSDTAKAVDVWGVRFAIDADVLGAVHAHVRLAGETISVSLWAEENATHAAFVASIPTLEAALKDNAMEIGELLVFPGKPVEQKRAASGHFLDRRS